MKRIISTMIMVFFALSSIAQTPPDSLGAVYSKKDSLTIGCLKRITQHTAQCYKLYPTENMWTFLELETYSGRIWQVQYSIKGAKYRFKTILNGESLVPYYDTEAYEGRFELYNTQNMYNFVLLDTKTGNTWQVQWSINEKDRAVLPIW